MTGEPMTPEQVADARTFLGQPGCRCEPHITQLCDSHESFRALAARLARALGAFAQCQCPIPSNPGCAKCPCCALLATPAVQALLTIKEDGDA